MPPRCTLDHAAHRTATYSEFPDQVTDALTFAMSSSDRLYDVLGQDRYADLFATRASTAVDRVLTVLSMGSQNQVSRVTAAGRVAGMSNDQPVRYLAVEQFVGGDVRADGLAIDLGVTVDAAAMP
jgi:hypothetical protein